MASRDGQQTVTLTCPSCNISVNQGTTTKRTICPNCGNFYDPQDSSRRRSHSKGRRTLHQGRPDQLNASSSPVPPSRRPTLSPRTTGSASSNPGQRRTVDARLPPDSISRESTAEEKDKSNSRLQSIANFFNQLHPSRRGRSNSDKDGSDSSTILPPIENNPASPTSYGDSSKGKGSPWTDTSSGTSSPRGTPLQKSKITSISNLKDSIAEARSRNEWNKVQDMYANTFESFQEITATFKFPRTHPKVVEDSGLDGPLVNSVYDYLTSLPQSVQKAVLKAIINCLLKDKRFNARNGMKTGQYSRDDLRAYLILLQNPQFSNMTTYVIFAHLLRQVAALQDQEHHYLVHWFKRLGEVRFPALLKRLQLFISIRLFPPNSRDLPPMTKCSWWIPSATKVMALLNAANNMSRPQVLPFTEFYNTTLEHLDLMAEYFTWQNPAASSRFSFCQYPFVLSISAKRTILQRDSEQQMIIMARRSLVAKVQRRQLPDIGMLFLNLNVRRSHLVSDSLNEISLKQHDLKKKLKVTFAGEPGLDMGGLTKEWFLLLIRQIFQPEYGMFVYNKSSRMFWFSTNAFDNHQEFNLVGVLMGLAVYNSINLDIHFPPCCYRKLLSPAVVPYNNPSASVGNAPLTVDDFAQVMPDVAQGLKELLTYEGDVEDDFCLTFQITYSEFGSSRTCSLKKNGDSVSVTNANRKEYVNLYVDYMLNRAIYRQFQAFYHGFHSVCASNALIMLRPEEVEMLVCGSPDLDMSQLQKVTVLDGYSTSDATVRYFWEIVLSMPKELQKRLLLFATGSDRIPIGGMSEMQLKITRATNLDMLPMAHTCFNQLVLPDYKSRKPLKQKLIIAIQNAEGFGLE